jgi:energy-coupling factor transporter ATP-binding protein EcfA2
MISRIELHNFMSHCRTVIEPAAGLTVLVGPNDCGKSAVVSALQILCENAQGDYMVRHGADECRIVLETADGHRVEWQRRKGVVSYNIDGEDFHRLSGGIPAQLHDVLRLAQVVAADNRDPYDIHFGAQKSPIFPLNEPGSRAATFFASSSDAAKLMEMQSLHRSKRAQARKDEARLAEQVNGLALRLEVLGPVAQLEQAVNGATEDYQAIADLSRRLCTLWQDQTDLSGKLAAVEQLEAEAAAFARLGTPPRLTDTSSVEEIIGPMAKNMGREARETDVIHVLDRLAEPPILVDLLPIDGLIASLSAQLDVRVHPGLQIAPDESSPRATGRISPSASSGRYSHCLPLAWSHIVPIPMGSKPRAQPRGSKTAEEGPCEPGESELPDVTQTTWLVRSSGGIITRGGRCDSSLRGVVPMERMEDMVVRPSGRQLTNTACPPPVGVVKWCTRRKAGCIGRPR